ncbi:hypothetical protein Pcinc_004966 [Petrolisthes cinctipes]|uniref:Uncharacterized protein n=1 Tax=Petrolisthes cinctipes TaxID=88211 RepID=A0AAE1GEL1_PETCI|nr:hypothetical protein Pcinc_004966 [Petrolisthes cinctipes]
MRRRVTGTSKTPTNWMSFLRDDTNKTELFHFLADKICQAETTSTIIVTKGEDAISNMNKSLDEVSPCCHEEADTQIFVHAQESLEETDEEEADDEDGERRRGRIFLERWDLERRDLFLERLHSRERPEGPAFGGDEASGSLLGPCTGEV